MWPFKKKEQITFEEPKQESEIEKVNRELKEINYKKNKYTCDDILHGADPWKIENTEIYGTNCYYIMVFMFDESRWKDLDVCCQEILGVTSKEFMRIMKDHYGALIMRDASYFESIEQVEKIIAEFRCYYEDFHMPRAVMKRLLCYTEGGLKPYFLDMYHGPIAEKQEENKTRRK